MNRISRLASCVCMAFLTLTTSAVAIQAQDAAAQPGFTPAKIQDEGSLTKKASRFIGFNMMRNLNTQRAGDINMDELYQGMKAAAEDVDKKSFVAGYQMFSDFKGRGFDLDLEEVFNGMKNAKAGQELGMSQEEVQSMMGAYQKMVEKKRFEKMKKVAADNLAEGEAYIAKMMAANPEVKKLPNGVMYEVLKDGGGKIPTPEDKVRIHYHGTFLDGSVFDSSIKPPSGAPPQPAELVVAQFVPGFSKALQSMSVGSKWKVVIPGPLAYGAAGDARANIQPNQTLVFEIELMGIVE